TTAGIVACSNGDDDDGGGPTGSTNGDESITAAEVLEQAATASQDVSSFHFVLTHENGTTPLPLNLNLESAEGDVVVPDRMRAEAEADALGINVNVDVIGIGERTWVTNPFTRQWQELEGTNIRDFANPAALISDVLPAIRDPQLSNGTNIDGVETHQVTGTLDSAALAEALGLAEAGRDVAVISWIGKDDMLPRRVRLEGALSDDESSNVVRQVDISRYNQPVEINPPE